MALSRKMSTFFIICYVVASVLCVEEWESIDDHSVESGVCLSRSRRAGFMEELRGEHNKLRKPWMKENVVGQSWINFTRDCGSGFSHTEGWYFPEEKNLWKYELICSTWVKPHPMVKGSPATEATLVLKYARRASQNYYSLNFYDFNSTHWWWTKKEQWCYGICTDQAIKNNGTVYTTDRWMGFRRRYNVPYLETRNKDGGYIAILELNKTQLSLDHPDVWFLRRVMVDMCPDECQLIPLMEPGVTPDPWLPEPDDDGEMPGGGSVPPPTCILTCVTIATVLYLISLLV